MEDMVVYVYCNFSFVCCSFEDFKKVIECGKKV